MIFCTNILTFMKDIILILSMWRSGTTWLERILSGELGQTFGKEPQILPFLACLRKEIRYKIKNHDAWLPLEDTAEGKGIEQLGYKTQKFFHGYFRDRHESYEDWAYRFINFICDGIESSLIVEKSPQNISIDAYNTALDVFSNRQNVRLVYLYREYKQFASSIYYKAVIKKNNNWPEDLEWFTTKWIKWNTNVCINLHKRPDNLFVVNYEDVINDITILKKIYSNINISNVKIKDTTEKWKDCEALDKILELEKRFKSEIDFIMNTNSKYSL